MTDLRVAAQRYRDRSKFSHYEWYRCPAEGQKYTSPEGLRRHMAKMHRMCRFCPKAYIMVDHHEKRMHTNEYAIAAGACKK